MPKLKGDKKTFIEGNTFYKEHTKDEFLYLKMLHGSTGLEIDQVMHDGTFYITMPKGHVISLDTIPKNKISGIQHIITDNIQFMLNQIAYLNNLGIYYSDCLQWLYYNDKLYLIDFDAAYSHEINRDYDNFNLLKNFFSYFEIDYSFVSESLKYLELFQTGDTFIYEFLKQYDMVETYNNLNDLTMQKNHVYHCRNTRHIQLKEKNIHIYGKSGNMIITDHLLNPETRNEWELLKIV